jgi:hypothetical protein
VLRGEALRAGRVTELLRELRPVLRRHLTVAARWDFPPDLKVKPEDLTAPGYAAGTKHSLGGEVEAIVGAFQVRPAVAYKAAARLRKWKPVGKIWAH